MTRRYERNFLICSATRKRLLASALIAGLLATPSTARKSRQLDKEDLINVMLSPKLAQWLVGPVARIATTKEIETYLEFTDDEEAEAFIDDFWQSRVDPANPWPGQQVKDLFDQRAERADRLFTESANLGRRTDRGSIYILFGEPARSGFVQDVSRRNATVEVWLYDPKSRIGLHGAPPEDRYYFTRRDGVMSFTGPPKVLKSARNR